ncbi:hypothetical protein WBP07_17825 [Novosphingobium sp. BL-8A]|uniref:hypothetical protein n=1 Tax=Novosphingobium sp. BL-8A TaxID=3127639 RepID=UPI0037573551
MTEHRIDIGLLGLIALGVLVLAGLSIWRNSAGEASAWTAVLMAIIGAIKERWQQRTIDRQTDALQASVPQQDQGDKP